MAAIEEFMNEFIARSASTLHAQSFVDFPGHPPSSVRALEESALHLVSEAATALDRTERRAAEKVSRAEHLAYAAIEKMQLAEARLERAEAAQRKAEAEGAMFAAIAAEAAIELKQARTLLAAMQAELAAVEQHARVTQELVKRVTEAVRTHFHTPDKKARAFT